jgi:hypothetical protein
MQDNDPNIAQKVVDIVGSASGDPSASTIMLRNEGGFVCEMAVALPSGGTTPWSSNIAIGQSVTVDLRNQNPPLNPGDSCCAAASIVMGPSDHRSGASFTYDPNAGELVYTISGTTVQPSWDSPQAPDGSVVDTVKQALDGSVMRTVEEALDHKPQ